MKEDICLLYIFKGLATAMLQESIQSHIEGDVQLRGVLHLVL